MGTDIHGVFQKYVPETQAWVDVPSLYEKNRHYQLFAVLAGVRNGTGFAGVLPGQALRPISEPRGYPADFVSETPEAEDDINTGGEDHHPISSMDILDPSDQQRYAKYYPGEVKTEIWMGDHSHSWLTGAEMLAWYASPPAVKHCGIVGVEVFKTWDRKTPPESYCGWTSGRGVRIIEQEDAERMFDPNMISADLGISCEPPVTHVRIVWDADLRSELAYFFDEVARLVKEHGGIRFVFGFDS